MLLAALLPSSLVADCAVPKEVASRFLALLHRALAASTAERLRRREELHASAAGGDDHQGRWIRGQHCLWGPPLAPCRWNDS